MSLTGWIPGWPLRAPTIDVMENGFDGKDNEKSTARLHSRLLEARQYQENAQAQQKFFVLLF